MAKQWSEGELQDLLARATPIVRQFLKGLAKKGTASAEDVGVSHLAPVIGLRYTKSRRKEPLYSSEKSAATGKSVFTIAPRYRRRIATFLATFKAPPPQPKRTLGRPRRIVAGPAPRRGPGRPRKTEMTPRRGPGRPRKLAVETMVASRHRRRHPRSAAIGTPGRTNGSFTLPAEALQGWSLWADLVAFANRAKKGGGSLVLKTDGQTVQLCAAK